MERYGADEDLSATRRLTIKELPASERPRERLIAKGPEALTDAELLAIIIRDGTRKESAIDLARKLLAWSNGSLRELSEKTISELCKAPGIGPARAAQIRAALTLASRLSGATLPRGSKFSNSEDVYKHFLPRIRTMKQECFFCLLLDTKNRVMREVEISKGGLNISLVNPRDVLKAAVAESAAGIIVVHNHPSGDPEPSQDDIRVTKRIKEACELTGIRFLDHVIVGEEGYRSLAEMRKM